MSKALLTTYFRKQGKELIPTEAAAKLIGEVRTNVRLLEQVGNTAMGQATRLYEGAPENKVCNTVLALRNTVEPPLDGAYLDALQTGMNNWGNFATGGNN